MAKVKKKFDHIELAKVIIEDSGYLDYLKKEEETQINLTAIKNRQFK